MLMGLSLLGASAGWAGLVFAHSVLDGDQSRHLAGRLMAHDGMRTVLVNRLGEGMERHLPADEPMSRQELRSAAAEALTDPLAFAALRDGLSEAHVLGLAGAEATPTFSAFDVNEAARHALIEARPALRGEILANPLVRIRLPVDGMTWFSGLEDLVDRFAILSLALGLIGFTTSFVIAETPSPALRRAAWWILASAAVWIVLAPVFSTLVRFTVPSSYMMAAAAAETVFRSMTTPAMVMAAFGVGLLSVSYLAPAFARRRGALLVDRARHRLATMPPAGAVPTTAMVPTDSERPPAPDERVMGAGVSPAGSVAGRLSAAWMEGHGYLDDDRVAPFFSGSPQEP